VPRCHNSSSGCIASSSLIRATRLQAPRAQRSTDSAAPFSLQGLRLRPAGPPLITSEGFYSIPCMIRFEPLLFIKGALPRGQEGDFPEAERASRESLALPVYPELTEEMQQYVIQAVRAFFSGH